MLLLELVKGMSLQDLRFKLSMVSNMCMIYVVKASLSIRTKKTRLDTTMHPLIQHFFYQINDPCLSLPERFCDFYC